uniref:Uncharacterized protein n=1 Tax=Anguilla anguilla TaxID=7936 RepID=A0A0E9PGT0_ANGAN
MTRHTSPLWCPWSRRTNIENKVHTDCLPLIKVFADQSLLTKLWADQLAVTKVSTDYTQQRARRKLINNDNVSRLN